MAIFLNAAMNVRVYTKQQSSLKRQLTSQEQLFVIHAITSRHQRKTLLLWSTTGQPAKWRPVGSNGPGSVPRADTMCGATHSHSTKCPERETDLSPSLVPGLEYVEIDLHFPVRVCGVWIGVAFPSAKALPSGHSADVNCTRLLRLSAVQSATTSYLYCILTLYCNFGLGLKFIYW